MARVPDDVLWQTLARDNRSRSLFPAHWFTAEKVEFGLLLAAVFLSPVNVLRTSSFYFTLSDLFFLLCFLIMAYNNRILLHPLGRFSTAIWAFGLVLLLFGLTLSSLVNSDPTRGMIVVSQYAFAYLLVLLVISRRTMAQLFTLSKAYVLCVVLMCIHGVYLIHVDGTRNTSFVSGSGRFMGFVERENECAALIALAVPLLCLLASEKRIGSITFLISLAITGYGVMLTGSNTGLASFVYGLGVFALLGLNWKRLAAAMVLLTAAVAASGDWLRPYLPTIFQKRVLGAIETGNLGEAGSFDHRLDLIHEALGRIESNLWVGLGADQYHGTGFVQQPVHNLFLLLWTEGGLVSALGFGIMLCSAFGPVLAAARLRHGMPYATCAFCSVSLFLVMVNAFPHVYGRFWVVPVLLAVAFAVACDTQGNSSRFNRYMGGLGGHDFDSAEL
jgi:hypothetical protein